LTLGGERTLVWSNTNSISNPHSSFSTRGAAINELGQFVGSAGGSSPGYYSTGVGFHSFLGNLIPTDLNNSRQIVGPTLGVAGLLDFDPNTTMIFGKLSPTDSSSQALGINQAGTIVGDFGGVSHAVILTPVPEPSSVALAGLALAGLSGGAVRKRFKPAT